MRSVYKINSILTPRLVEDAKIPLLIKEIKASSYQILSPDLVKLPSDTPDPVIEVEHSLYRIISSEDDASEDLKYVLMIQYVISPPCAKNIRKRSRPSELKILYALYQLYKNVRKGKWHKIAPGKARISRVANTSIKAVTNFVTGEGLCFFDKQTRFRETNVYHFHPKVIQLFDLLERKGFMKGFFQATDFKGWKNYFLKRVEGWLIPLLKDGWDLGDILGGQHQTKKPQFLNVPTIGKTLNVPSINQGKLKKKISNLNKLSINISLERYKRLFSQDQLLKLSLFPISLVDEAFDITRKAFSNKKIKTDPRAYCIGTCIKLMGKHGLPIDFRSYYASRS